MYGSVGRHQNRLLNIELRITSLGGLCTKPGIFTRTVIFTFTTSNLYRPRGVCTIEGIQL